MWSGIETVRCSNSEDVLLESMQAEGCETESEEGQAMSNVDIVEHVRWKEKQRERQHCRGEEFDLSPEDAEKWCEELDYAVGVYYRRKRALIEEMVAASEECERVEAELAAARALRKRLKKRAEEKLKEIVADLNESFEAAVNPAGLKVVAPPE
jgi:multidrug resistance efflux pump